MARKAPSAPPKTEPALLTKPREEVRAQLIARIDMETEFHKSHIGSNEGFEALKADYQKWDQYNTEFLRRAFTTEEYAKEYERYGPVSMLLRQQSLGEKISELSKRIIEKRNRLISIAERLDLIDEQPGSPFLVRENLQVNVSGTKKVFVVHGQDEETMAIVARFISGCGLEPIVLHEQANNGRTIIEKFEDQADVGFAVVLLTPDDVGGRRKGDELTTDEPKARARQNVILELGYFVGRLGRGKVAALKKGDLELPSDIAGFVWTPIDTADAWKMSLARELKAAGYEFDVAKALGI